MYLQTQGYILKYRNWREGDRIYTIYTERVGKMEMQARGTRKAQSKLAGQLRLFSLISFNFVHGKQRFQLIGAQVLQNYKLSRSNRDPDSASGQITNYNIGYGYYLLELVDELTRVGQRSEEIFSLLEEGIQVLGELACQKAEGQLGGPASMRGFGQEQYKRLRVAFLLKLLKATGFNPEKRIRRGDVIQGALERYLHQPIGELVGERLNGELKGLFNISQYALNEVIEKPLKTVKFLQNLIK